MSVQSNIVLNDGKTTPVAHTFNPKGAKREDKKDVALWRDQSPASAVGYLTLREEHTPVNANGMEKFVYVIDVPTLESPSSGGSFVPPPTRAYGTIAKIEVWAHQRASESELKDIVAYVKNFTATAYFSDAITKREAAW